MSRLFGTDPWFLESLELALRVTVLLLGGLYAIHRFGRASTATNLAVEVTVARSSTPETSATERMDWLAVAVTLTKGANHSATLENVEVFARDATNRKCIDAQKLALRRARVLPKHDCRRWHFIWRLLSRTPAVGPRFEERCPDLSKEIAHTNGFCIDNAAADEASSRLRLPPGDKMTLGFGLKVPSPICCVVEVTVLGGVGRDLPTGRAAKHGRRRIGQWCSSVVSAPRDTSGESPRASHATDTP